MRLPAWPVRCKTCTCHGLSGVAVAYPRYASRGVAFIHSFCQRETRWPATNFLQSSLHWSSMIDRSQPFVSLQLL